MLCPVCKTECGTESVCKECGFNQIQVEFLSREEATYWLENVVEPFRKKFDDSKIAHPIDWKEILLKQKNIQYFFDVTIPAAMSKNEVFAHTLLICPNRKLREAFVEHLKSQLPYREFKDNLSHPKMRMGDFASLVTNIQPGDVLILNAKELPSERMYCEHILKAFKEFILPFTIGKGVKAQLIQIDLAPFTALSLVNKLSDIPERYRPIFENVIEIKIDKQENCKLEIQAIAMELELKVLPSAVDVIAAESNNDIIKAVNCVKHINDYLFVKGKSKEVITADLAREIISRFI